MYDQKVRDKVCEFIADGAENDEACLEAGISEAIFYKWKNEDLDFLEAVKAAETRFVAKNRKAIDADKTWQSKAWRLERKRRNVFGRNDQTTNVAIQVNIEAPEVKEAAELLKKARRYGINGHNAGTNGNGHTPLLDNGGFGIQTNGSPTQPL